MKKVLIIGLLLGAGWYVFGGTKSETTTPIQPTGDIFQQYNGRVIADKDGYYMLVKEGKLYTPIDLASLQAWQRANPLVADTVIVPVSVWTVYSQEHYGGTF